MKIELTFDDVRFRADLGCPIELAQPVRFDDEGPGAFFLAAARQSAVRADGFVGDVREGGSVNCTTLELRPHGNGTHTECVGHVLEERVFVVDVLPPTLQLAVVLTAEPVPFASMQEPYDGKRAPDDLVVTGASLREAFAGVRGDSNRALPEAVLVRSGRVARDFSGTSPPYLTLGAMDFLLNLDAEHVLTDLPSLDREDDGGALACHRRLWGLAPGQRRLDGAAPSRRTVTELCRFPASLEDGFYLLALQVPALFSDAVPSRPVLFPLEEA